MVSERNCTLPSGGTLVLAVVLTYLTLALWTDHKQTSNTPENPPPFLSLNASTVTDKLHSFQNLSKKTTNALLDLVYPIHNFPASLANLSKHASQHVQPPWASIFSSRSLSRSLPTSYYDGEPHGAIDIFENHSITVCRLYKVCRRRDGHLLLPEWTQKYAHTLRNKCGLSKLHYQPTWTLKTSFGLRPYYDWIAPDLPAHELLNFTQVPLSYFFVPRKGRNSLLEDATPGTKINRTCFSPGVSDTSKLPNRICDSRPEARISNPAFLVNVSQGNAKVDKALQVALTAEFLRVHGVEADVFDQSSPLLKRSKACFRSLIVAPAFAHVQQVNDFTERNVAVNASRVAEGVINAAEKTLSKEIQVMKKKHSGKADKFILNSKRKEGETGAQLKQQRENKASKAGNTRQVTKRSMVSTNSTIRLDKVQKQNLNEATKLPSPSPTTPPSGSPSARAAKSNKRNPLAQLGLIPSTPEPSKLDSLFHSEGGVELFTHRALHGQQWNHTSQTYGVCRVHRACRRRDQTLVLPQWMQSIEKDLRSHCGLSSIEYVNETTLHELYTRSKLSNLDLMGVRVYRAQEQHFMTDFFHDGLHAFDALFNQQSGRHSIFKRRCVYNPVSNVAQSVRDNRDCIGIRTDPRQLRPAVLIHERTKKGGSSTRYIRELLSMMPKAKVLYPNKLDNRGPSNSTCFRSIVLTRNSYPPRYVLQHREENIFFASNNISRKSVLHQPKGSQCTVQLTILKPTKQARHVGWKRKMAVRAPSWEVSNLDEVLQQVQLIANRSNVSVQVGTFEHNGGVKFAKQAIQKSEIILGVNNPAMTSITFARPHTTVIEVQPFAYSVGPYRSFARSLHLDHRTVTARPDIETFTQCVRENYREDWEGEMKEEEMQRRMQGLLQLFHEAANGSDLQLSRRTHKGELRWQRIPLERVCARAQTVLVNPNQVAKLVVDDAKAICRRRHRRPVPNISATDI